VGTSFTEGGQTVLFEKKRTLGRLSLSRETGSKVSGFGEVDFGRLWRVKGARLNLIC